MSTDYNVKPRQIKALVLLLALLPLVPTILTLRFMAESSRAENLAIHTELQAIYQGHLATVGSYLDKFLAREFITPDGDTPELDALIAHLADEEIDGLLIAGPDRSLSVPSGVGDNSFPPIPEQALTLSAAVASAHSGPQEIQSLPGEVWFELPKNPTVYARTISSGRRVFIILRTQEHLTRIVRGFCKSAIGTADDIFIIHHPTGAPPHPNTMATAEIEATYPQWRVELVVDTTNSIDASIREQNASYRIIGVLMVGGILLVAGLAGYAITRQIRLHELRSSAIAAVAHELKTPLASTRLLLDTLRDGRISDPAKREEYLTLISTENERLSRITGDFLTFSRMEARDYAPRLTKVSLVEVVRRAASVLDVHLNDPRAGLELDLPPEDEIPTIMADRDALNGMVRNLIENAVRHSNKTEKKVIVRLSSTNRHVELTISDNGPGIPNSELKTIFQPFHQLDNRLSRTSEGCGLGLSIVQQTVEAHRGKIRVDSAMGKGTTFTITLPTA